MNTPLVQADCDALQAAIATLSELIPAFIFQFRAARVDLDGISRELASLRIILALLAVDSNDGIPVVLSDRLQSQIRGIVVNCTNVISDIESSIESSINSEKSMDWSISAKQIMVTHRPVLEAHRCALEITLEMLPL